MAAFSRLDESFAAALRERWPAGERYLVAVSGGCDSMALLHFLRAAGYRDLVACHVNHGLRGEDADADEALVRREAERLGCSFEGVRPDVSSLAKESGHSLETAARELRYGHFAEVAARLGCPRLLLAHHADDQVETVLINLFRGGGARGLAGMEPERRRRIRGTDLRLIRPLLDVTRDEIRRWAAANEVTWREDSSNAEPFALRNRVRHRLLPALEEVFERDVRAAVWRAAELARLDEAWAAEALGEPPRLGDGLDVKALRAMPEARRDRLVLAWLRENGVPDCGYGEVAAVAEAILSKDRPAKVNLPGGRHARRREGVLFLE